MLGLCIYLLCLISSWLSSASPVDLSSLDVIPEDTSHSPSRLQARRIICASVPGPPIIWADCIHAWKTIPVSVEGVNFHYPPGTGEFPNVGPKIIDTPLTVDGNPMSLYNLPRSYSHGTCSISLDLEPGLSRADVLLTALKYRVSMIMNICVGGGTELQPGNVHLGLGGNETYQGVRIGITHT